MKQYKGLKENIAFLLFLCVPAFYAVGITFLYESWRSFRSTDLGEVGFSVILTALGLVTFFAGNLIYRRCKERLERTAFSGVGLCWLVTVLGSVSLMLMGVQTTSFTKSLVCMGALHAAMILKYALSTPIERQISRPPVAE